MFSNMKKFLALIIISFFSQHTIGQTECKCIEEFNNLNEFIEKNYVGFHDKVTDASRAEYTRVTNEAIKKANEATTPNYCYYTLTRWLNYFKDGHLQLISKPSANAESSETINLPLSLDALKNKSNADIEGIYNSDTKNYEIAIVRNSNSFRDYAGVIINTSVKSWKSGQVKLELKHIMGDQYEGIYYFKDHHPEVKTYTFKDGRFYPPDFSKINLSASINSQDPEPFSKLENSNKVVFYKDIDDSTAYLRIKSFDDYFEKKINTVIKSNEKKIKSKPYLILDIRFNGGGADFTYTPLLQFIYTNPILTVGVDVYSTPANILSWQRVLEENQKLPEDVKKRLSQTIEKMKTNPNKLISIVPDEIDTIKTGVYKYPRKVAVLMDVACASSAEQFLLTTKQSRKVILIGQHSAGVLDYSNMRLAELKCLGYILGYSTTRSRRIPYQAIDGKGIMPDIELSFENPWLGEVMDILSK